MYASYDEGRGLLYASYDEGRGLLYASYDEGRAYCMPVMMRGGPIVHQL